MAIATTASTSARVGVDEDADRQHLPRQQRDDRRRGLGRDVARALRIEVEAEEIGAGLDRRDGVRGARDAADLDAERTLGRIDHANNSRSAAPGSGARMNVSPIRNARTPAASKRARSRGRLEAALDHHRASRRHRAEQLEPGLEPRDEGVEVAVVDADHGRARGERALELLGRVHLDQRRHVHLAPERHQLADDLGTQDRRDQEKRVGTGRARLVDLVRLEEEVLAEQRHGDVRRESRPGGRGCPRRSARR